MDKLVALLEPFEEITRQISADDATLADVIPVVTALQLTLERHGQRFWHPNDEILYC